MSISFVRWQPWQEVETVRRQLDQLFEEMVPLTRESFSTTVNRAVRVPAIELTATENALVLCAELPGFEPDDLDIQVTRDSVSMRGMKKSATQTEPTLIEQIQTEPSETPSTDEANVSPATPHVYTSEFRTGAFHRVVTLPVEVDPDQTVAVFKNGLLTLTMPKREDDRTRSVKVSL
jgi:HSP20 family protein